MFWDDFVSDEEDHPRWDWRHGKDGCSCDRERLGEREQAEQTTQRLAPLKPERLPHPVCLRENQRRDRGPRDRSKLEASPTSSYRQPLP